MPMKPIKKNYVSDQVLDEITRAIVNKEWLPGTRIPSENELCIMLAVSRISVREAIHKLASLGILETRHGEGTYVGELNSGTYMNWLIPIMVLDQPDIMNILEFRMIIEVESARLAALRANEEDISDLELILKKMHESTDNLQIFHIYDLNFHMQIAKMTKNSMIIKVNYILKDLMTSVFQEIVAALGYTRGIYYHTRILDAIKLHDEVLAKQAMTEHLESTLTEMLKVQANHKIQ